MTVSCLVNGGQPSWFARWQSHMGVSITGSVKVWSGRASSMNPCIVGSCGPTKQSRNAFERIISVRLGTISASAGRMHHLPNNADEDNIQANQERRAQWQALRNRKRHLGVVWLGHRAHLRLAFDVAQTRQRL